MHFYRRHWGDFYSHQGEAKSTRYSCELVVRVKDDRYFSLYVVLMAKWIGEHHVKR